MSGEGLRTRWGVGLLLSIARYRERTVWSVLLAWFGVDGYHKLRMVGAREF